MGENISSDPVRGHGEMTLRGALLPLPPSLYISLSLSLSHLFLIRETFYNIEIQHGLCSRGTLGRGTETK